MSDSNKIEIMKEYDAYNDGKTSPSRLVRVVVDKVILRRDMTRREQGLWRKALKDDFRNVFDGCVYYLYDQLGEIKQFWDWNCRQFVVGHIKGCAETIKDRMIFARTLAGDWYGVNWNYMLDALGEIRKKSMPNWEKCAKEMGHTIRWNEEIGKFEYFDKEGNKVE